MANELPPIVPKILSQGLMALRTQLVMPRLVNMDYQMDAAEFGDVINVPVPSAQAAQDVNPSPNQPAVTSTKTRTTPIPLDQWKYTDFHLTDKQMKEIDRNRHFIPMQTSESIQTLSAEVNQHIFRQYKRVYGATGVAGTTPFATNDTAARNLRKILLQQRTPKMNRRAVLDFDAEALALGLDSFKDVSASSDRGIVIEGEIGRKFGFNWFSDDHVPTHVAGSVTGTPTSQTGAATPAGSGTVPVATGAGEGIDLVEGDLITFAGNSQVYAVTADVEVAASTTGNVSIYPDLVADLPASSVLSMSVADDHVVNLGFHRDAFAFANRPLAMGDMGMMSGAISQNATDPMTGISLRLEVIRQNKQCSWQFDILWGAALVRPELAARLLG